MSLSQEWVAAFLGSLAGSGVVGLLLVTLLIVRMRRRKDSRH